MRNAIRVSVRRRHGAKNWELYWRDPFTDEKCRKSAGTHDRRQAERAAVLWEQHLSQRQGGLETNWDTFVTRVYEEYLPNVAEKTQENYRIALKMFEKHMGQVRRLDLIDGSTISTYKSKLRATKIADATIANRLRGLKALLRWAVRMNMLRECPPFEMPRNLGKRLARGRPVTEAEFHAMLEAVKAYFLQFGEVDPTPESTSNITSIVDMWQRFLWGLWHSGLRVEECYRLQWDKGLIHLDLESKKVPVLVFRAEGQKSRRDETIPITPEFAEFLRATPPEQRHGLVFPLRHPRRTIDRTILVKTVSCFGELANIRVNDEGKFASAHDIRRSFGTRLAKRGVKPMTLKTLMRHSSIVTTYAYYVDSDINDLADDLWR